MALFTYSRIPQFSETDAAGIIHFSRIACYVEEAEHAFLHQAGFPLDLRLTGGYHWPRVNFNASYFAPVYPFFPLQVDLNVKILGRCSVTWQWAVFDSRHAKVLCKGEMKTVCCQQHEGKLAVCPLPEKLREKLAGK